MRFTRKEKRIYFFIFSLTCFLVVFTLYQNFKPTSQNKLRNLITVDEMNERCQKTKREFKEKYADDPKNYVIENVKLDKYQYVLKEVIDEEDYGKIRKYLPRILVYLIIGIIDIIFIIFWILFCCYACKNVERQNRIGCGAKCCFIIFFILCIGVILLSVIGVIYTPYLKKGFNAIACSGYKIIFHFLNGTIRENEELKWIGLYNISGTLYNLDDIGYKEEIETIEKMISTFEDINNKTLGDIEKAMEDLDCLYPYNSYIYFGGVAIFNLLGLLSMFLIFVCECKCMSCLFHTFWNIEIIFIIATFAISAVLGSFSVVSKDLSKILLNQKNQTFFNSTLIFNFSEISEQINICLNEKGDFYSNLFKYKDFHNDLEEKKNMVLNETELKNEYNCSFFEMDYKILADELSDTIAKKLYFISLLFIIVDAAAIVSIFFGITIYNSQKSYYPPKEINVNIDNRIPNNNNRVDLSTENLKRQNNEVIFSKK